MFAFECSEVRGGSPARSIFGNWLPLIAKETLEFVRELKCGALIMKLRTRPAVFSLPSLSLDGSFE